LTSQERWATFAAYWVVVFTKQLAVAGECHRHGRDIDEAFQSRRQRETDQFSRSDDVGAEQLRIRQHVVYERRRMHDDVDRPGETRPSVEIETEVTLGEVARQHLEVLARERGKVSVEGLISVAERFDDPAPCLGGIRAAIDEGADVATGSRNVPGGG
jgi:hypothetical protein